MREFYGEEGRIKIALKAIPMGNDLCIIITGGHRPHLGAVALGLVRPSLSDYNKSSASVSVLAVPCHKEDDLVRVIARKITTKLRLNSVVSCGIHVDNLTPAEIDIIVRITDELSDHLITALS